MIDTATIQMVDLKTQYSKIKSEIDAAINECIESAAFINGPQVKKFSQELAAYLGVGHVIPCANGTDALQIALMALGLERGDEVIVPAFTYVATAEVIGLLGLTPVLVDVDPLSFNIAASEIEKVITPKTKAIVPVHLYGQCADMDAIMEIAGKHSLFVVEDTAQSIGSKYTHRDGHTSAAGTIGHIGCTSFFPSKNLGCYGDGGAVFTNDIKLGVKLSMIANHGQVKKYVHKYIGVNSRLDSIQAAILSIKLTYLNEYSMRRRDAADYYDSFLSELEEVSVPARSGFSTHVFHQYTLRIKNKKRDALKEYLETKGVPSMVYYPVPLNEQEAFGEISRVVGSLDNTRDLCESVLSLPMHSELTESQLKYIVDSVYSFFNKQCS